MLLRAKTGTATLFQFIANTILGFLSGVIAIISGCYRATTGECASSAFVSLMLVLLVVAAYAVLLAIGYLAQERRDRRLALLLIGAEVIACLIFVFDARHTPSTFDRLTNIAQLVVAAWVIFIAFRQFRAKSGRMVNLKTERVPRQRF